MQAVSKESNLVMWDLLTNENTVDKNAASDTGSDLNIEENDTLKEKEKESSFSTYNHAERWWTKYLNKWSSG